ncbi:TetR/AcrR family transcriptional regulator [Capsulimonas corticalis]|nr:TetR family transcriptional regulator [Capsulimonas corticalis]
MSCPANEPSDPRVRRTRALLQNALRDLLHEKKFGVISVQDIAERATVNRATFYAHFDDKYALLSCVLRSELGAKLWSRFPKPTPLTCESLTLLAAAVFEFIGEMRTQCPDSARDMENTMGSILQEEIYEFIDTWLRIGGLAPPLRGQPRETVATVFSWSIYGAAHRWSRSDRKQTAEDAAREISALLMPARELSAV